MKKILISAITIIIFSIFLCFISCKDIEKSYYPDGALECEIEGKDGIRNGVSKCYYPNGKVKIEGVCKDDKEQGEFREYYETGSLWGVYNYEKGLLEGSYTEYYEDGNIKSEMTYKNNELNGVAKFYYKNGKTSMEAYSENNQTLYYTKYDSLGNWVDEYRWINITLNDTVQVGEKFTLEIELKGLKITEKDSVLFIFSTYKYENLEIIEDTTINITPSNLLHFSYIAKEDGYYGYTGLFLTNRANQKRKEHQIPKGSFYVVNNEKTAMN